MILTFFLYIFLGGIIANMIYWSVASLLTGSIMLPLVTMKTKRAERSGEELTLSDSKGLIALGSFFTILTSAGWAFIASYIVLLAITNAGAFGWQKWIFLIFGFFLALYHPGAMEKESSLQTTVANVTIMICYIAQVIFLISVEIPKFM